MDQLNAAPSLEVLTVLPSNRLEKLSGDLQGTWSLRINDQWGSSSAGSTATPTTWTSSTITEEGTHMLPKNRPPTHPGEMLLKEFLEPLGVSQSEFARHLGWTFARLNEIVNGRRRITADSALALGEALGTGPELWLNLQRDWDLWHSLQHRSPIPLLKKLAAAHHPSA